MIHLTYLAGLAAQATTNPLCTIFNKLKPWAVGAIMVGLIALVLVWALGHLNSKASKGMMGGIVAIAFALILLGIVVNPATMATIAGWFGATGNGLDWRCPTQ